MRKLVLYRNTLKICLSVLVCCDYYELHLKLLVYNMHNTRHDPLRNQNYLNA